MEELNKKGVQLYKKNKNFKLLADIMENRKFREFYNLYLTDIDNVKIALIFMKLYEAVEKNSKVKLTPYQKISIIKDLFENKNLRMRICKNINNNMNIENNLLLN